MILARAYTRALDVSAECGPSVRCRFSTCFFHFETERLARVRQSSAPSRRRRRGEENSVVARKDLQERNLSIIGKPLNFVKEHSVHSGVEYPEETVFRSGGNDATQDIYFNCRRRRITGRRSDCPAGDCGNSQAGVRQDR